MISIDLSTSLIFLRFFNIVIVIELNAIFDTFTSIEKLKTIACNHSLPLRIPQKSHLRVKH